MLVKKVDFTSKLLKKIKYRCSNKLVKEIVKGMIRKSDNDEKKNFYYYSI